MNKTRTLAIGVALIAASALPACGSGDSADADDTRAASTTASGFPVTIANCGTDTTYDAPPQRAMVIYQHPTEIMLALGLQEVMVGTAYMDGPIRADLAPAYESVPEVAEKAPTREQILAVEPDIVVAGWDSAFDDDSAGSRESLDGLNIDSYLETSSCPEFDDEASIDLARTQIEDLGAIFGVPDRAAKLVEELMAPIEEVEKAIEGTEPVDVFVYDSGDELAYTTGGRENTTALLELAGGRNVFGDVDDTWAEVSWEEVVARDPEYIVILDYTGSATVEEKQQFLRSNPVTSTLEAVREGWFVVLELTDVVPGIRNGDAVKVLAEGLHPGANLS